MANVFAAKYEDMDVDELEFELEDLSRAIEAERSWGSELQSEAGRKLLSQKVNDLIAEANYIRKRIRELVAT